jgi:hypothetical protein
MEQLVELARCFEEYKRARLCIGSGFGRHFFPYTFERVMGAGVDFKDSASDNLHGSRRAHLAGQNRAIDSAEGPSTATFVVADHDSPRMRQVAARELAEPPSHSPRYTWGSQYVLGPASASGQLGHPSWSAIE